MSMPRLGWPTRVLCSAVLLCAVAGAALGQAAASPTLAVGEVDPNAASLIDQIMSPFCPGLILTNCPTLAADSLRRAIRDRFTAGATRDQVVKELHAMYGDAISAAPARTGLGLLAWIVPALGILVAGFFITMLLRRRGATPRVRPNAPADATSENRALEAELAQRLREG